MQEPQSALLMKMRAMAPQLSATERKVVDCILSCPREVIHLSITGLAEMSGVSDATVVRLCKRLGMQGYQELKVTLAQDIVSPIETIHEDVREDDTPQMIVEKVFQGTIHALQYTQRILDLKQFTEAVGVLDRAGRINIYGLGNSGSVAMDMEHKLLRIGLPAAAYTDSHMQCIAATLLKPGDACVCISHSGSSRDVIDAAKLCKEAGAIIISLTNIGRNPLSDLADIRLDTASKETEYRIIALSSRISQYTIIDSLYTTLALKRRESKRAQTHVIEKALEKKKY